MPHLSFRDSRRSLPSIFLSTDESDEDTGTLEKSLPDLSESPDEFDDDATDNTHIRDYFNIRPQPRPRQHTSAPLTPSTPEQSTGNPGTRRLTSPFMPFGTASEHLFARRGPRRRSTQSGQGRPPRLFHSSLRHPELSMMPPPDTITIADSSKGLAVSGIDSASPTAQHETAIDNSQTLNASSDGQTIEFLQSEVARLETQLAATQAALIRSITTRSWPDQTTNAVTTGAARALAEIDVAHGVDTVYELEYLPENMQQRTVDEELPRYESTLRPLVQQPVETAWRQDLLSQAGLSLDTDFGPVDETPETDINLQVTRNTSAYQADPDDPFQAYRCSGQVQTDGYTISYDTPSGTGMGGTNHTLKITGGPIRNGEQIRQTVARLRRRRGGQMPLPDNFDFARRPL